MNDNDTPFAVVCDQSTGVYRVCKTTSRYGHYRNYRDYKIYTTYHAVPDYFFWGRDTEILAEGLSYAEADALCKLLRQSEDT